MSTINPKNCVCCSEEIKPLYEEYHSKDSPSQSMWLDGVVGEISAGFGSSLDGEKYIIAICDNCIREKLITGIIENNGRYML